MKTHYGDGARTLDESIMQALPYFVSNAMHHDRDNFSRKLVLPWLATHFPQVSTATRALDIGGSHGVSATALLDTFPGLLRIDSVDHSPGAQAIGKYLTGQQSTLGTLSMAELDELPSIGRKIANAQGYDVSQLLARQQKRYSSAAENITFLPGTFEDLGIQEHYGLIYHAMGWHWAIKSQSEEALWKQIISHAQQGAIFCTYTFGLADQHAMETERNAETYLTKSPIFTSFYQRLEEEIQSEGLAKELTTPSAPYFPSDDHRSGLLATFEDKLEPFVYDVLSMEIRAELIESMTLATTANHFSLFSGKHKEALEQYATRHNLSEEEAVAQALQNASEAWRNDLSALRTKHKQTGPYYELLPTVAGVIR